MHSRWTMCAIITEPWPSLGHHKGPWHSKRNKDIEDVNAKLGFYGGGLEQHGAVSVLSLPWPLARSQITP